MKTKIFKINLCVIFSFIYACTSSDDFLVQEESALFEVEASILNGGDSAVKEISIAAGDTVTLIGSLLGAKSSDVSSYSWKISDDLYSPDLFWKPVIKIPDDYTARFIVVDRHKDTLSDTVLLHVLEIPKMDSSRFIPKNKSQLISLDSVLFSWDMLSSSKDSLKFYFHIECADFVFDTLLSNSWILLKRSLPELEFCRWNVSVQNREGISGNSLSATFTTKSKTNSARFSGQISVTPNNLLDSVRVFYYNKETPTEIKNLENFPFDSGIIPSGKYVLVASLPAYADYKDDTLEFELKENVYKRNLYLKLFDGTVPGFLDALKDTLPSASHFRIPLKNYGPPLSKENVEVTVDKIPIDADIRNDTLLFALPKYSLPVPRFLKIEITDHSGNSLRANFIVEAKNSWLEMIFEPSVKSGEDVNVKLRESNPYHLILEKIQIKKENFSLEYQMEKGEEIEMVIPDSILALGKNILEITTKYSNGLELQDQIQIEVLE